MFQGCGNCIHDHVLWFVKNSLFDIDQVAPGSYGMVALFQILDYQFQYFISV